MVQRALAPSPSLPPTRGLTEQNPEPVCRGPRARPEPQDTLTPSHHESCGSGKARGFWDTEHTRPSLPGREPSQTPSINTAVT